MSATDALHMVNRLYARLNGRRPEFDQREQYYEGNQPLTFATEEWKRANASRYADFSDNWCGSVVDAEAERLRYTGVKLDESTYGDAAKKLHEQWLLNEMDMQSSQGFVASLTSSRSYVIVWADPFTQQPTISWEHGADVEIEYDWANSRVRTAALKTWADSGFEYATLYTPNWVWKFQRLRSQARVAEASQADQSRVRNAGSTGGWVAREVHGEPWPLVNPMGVVPVVEFANRPTLKGDPRSEIQGVIPMQNAINLLWAYLFLAADYASMPARVVLHQGPPKMPVLDSEGKQIGEKAVDIKDLAEKRLLYLSGADTAIDSWESAKLDVFTGVIEKAVGHIAAQTRTPPTYLVSTAGMSNVNGEGLKASEIGLVKKSLEFQSFASPAIREVYRLVALVLGDQSLAQAARLATVTWANPEIRSEAQLADALLKKKQLGYPLEYLMEVDGLDPVDIARVLKMREEELNDPQIAAAMRGLDDSSGGSGSVPSSAGSGGGDGS
ncbi:Phage portal protein, SPP1 Gp6-like [Agromyces sp. CF514]|uniref:phage portal protein n=1 Tax=Agromyces sp. CF514 TaxID=1881031 RepID=UPI0008E6C92B|nr:phage portal protein [Agromyces sp. CF514]SFR76069.1 Phage portal protein, SPP1 Gp6-like [Agromyces sp. CF514]